MLVTIRSAHCAGNAEKKKKKTIWRFFKLCLVRNSDKNWVKIAQSGSDKKSRVLGSGTFRGPVPGSRPSPKMKCIRQPRAIVPRSGTFWEGSPLDPVKKSNLEDNDCGWEAVRY